MSRCAVCGNARYLRYLPRHGTAPPTVCVCAQGFVTVRPVTDAERSRENLARKAWNAARQLPGESRYISEH